MDMDEFKGWVKFLIVYFIISQIISYKMYGPYSLLCWNEVTATMFLYIPVGGVILFVISLVCILAIAVIIGVPGYILFRSLGWWNNKSNKENKDDEDDGDEDNKT